MTHTALRLLFAVTPLSMMMLVGCGGGETTSGGGFKGTTSGTSMSGDGGSGGDGPVLAGSGGKGDTGGSGGSGGAVDTTGCGDGIVQPELGEKCDDGNNMSGDGCSADCKTVEHDFVCLTPGKACQSTVKCGDGKVGGMETCDDGNTKDHDGCSADCQVEDGWQCGTPGRPCSAASCGDGIVAGKEQCDDGNNDDHDGCSANCTLEPGFACDKEGSPPKSVCHATVCGDNVKEGFEECDYGDTIPYDGCSPTCTVEPKCAGGSCTATCGDGLKFPQEACDDGNTSPGDGCDASCQIEPGWKCTATDEDPPDSLVIPILYRDFLYNGTSVPGMGDTDFEHLNNGLDKGLVNAMLGADNEPIFAKAGSSLSTAENFCWWYHETGCAGAGSTNPYDKLVYLDLGGNPTTLTLNSTGTNVYQFASSTFFPVDGLGWNAGANPQVSLGHNFSFTSELHYPFTYSSSAAPTFTFFGDDDVWAFINGQLAVDLGGIHGGTGGTITLDAAHASTLGLVDGKMYSIDLFQAERHTSASNYTLTLSGFTHTVSTCHTICGDSIVAGDETCDDGVNDGSYDGCNGDCTPGPRCGDGTVQTDHEDCDDGVNLATYSFDGMPGCAPGCKLGSYCGDGKIDSIFGEECDVGADKNTGKYGGCKSDCTLGPRCGDGIVQKDQGEQCDDGNTVSGDGCSSSCKSEGPR